jgi:hypothetical protein
MLVLFVLLLSTLIVPAHAEPVDFFHRETDKFWSVSGGAGSETGQATCYGSATKKDGSFVEIHRSLVDGEVWAIIHDTAWEIQNEERGTLRWNFFGRYDALIDGSDLQFVVKDKNTVLILRITPQPLSEVIWNTRYFTLVMPGNLHNLSVSFETRGSSMLNALAECINQNKAKYEDFKPAQEKVPDSVKKQL